MRTCLSLLALCCLFTSGASAADLYIGAGVGQSSAESIDGLARVELEETGYRGFFGVQINEYFAFEGAYVDLGSDSGTVDAVNFDIEGSYVAGFFLGSLPAGSRTSLFAKAGFADWDIDVVTDDGGGAVDSGDGDQSFMWGLGVKFNMTQALALRLEYERGDFGTFDDVNFASLNLHFDF